MNIKQLITLALSLSCIDLVKAEYSDLRTMQWLHGSESCKADINPAIQVVQAGAKSYVLRQNKCVTFEAPFIYVLVGTDKILVVDTGANADPEESPIYATVASLIAQQTLDPNMPELEILVVHSHSHSDHRKGDAQFANRENVKVIGTGHEDLVQQLGFKDWPNNPVSLDLGERIVTLIPIPGHQDQSIAIYDEKTGWLLTGDTFYPGSIRIKDWDVFKASIQRLVLFSNHNQVSLILGGHIEMNSETNKIYPIGATYQPNEPPLALNVDQLKELNTKLKQTKSAKKLNFQSFVIDPLNRFEKMIIKVMSRKKNKAE